MTDEVKRELVIGVITELGLIKAKDTIIGDEKVRGVSGGERKRVNIACQLISNPQILFLDEPTSGLDAFQALSVTESMKVMAMRNRLVIAVIHQPRSSIFDMFDKLLLLSGGRTMYYGDAKDAASWFTSCGYPCPRLFNPSDYFLDILSYDNRTKELDEFTTMQVDKLGNMWAEQVKKTVIDAESPAVTNTATDGDTTDQFVTTASTKDSITHPTPQPQLKHFVHRFFKNLMLLSWRSWNQQIRDSVTIKGKLFITIFFACLTAGMYNHAGNDPIGIYNRLGLLFIVSSTYI